MAAIVGSTTSIVLGTELNIGKVVTPAELAGWNINVFPDGKGYPPGSGTVAKGEQVYQNSCVACHGTRLEGGSGSAVAGGKGPALAGGAGSLDSEKPLKTVGSYWPYASTLFDYIRRAMPFYEPQSLSNEDVYSVAGYILHVNGLLPKDAVVDANTLKGVQMPNKNGFYIDDRPDVKSIRCMVNCSGQP